jgi:hypothetical protein
MRSATGVAKSYTYRLNNNLVQAYWSQQDQAYIVSTGSTTSLPAGLGAVVRVLTRSAEYYTNYVTNAATWSSTPGGMSLASRPGR